MRTGMQQLRKFSRRQAVKALAGFAGSIALSIAHAQSRKTGVPVIGVLSANRIDDREIDAIRTGLRDAGYTDGTTVAIDQLSADSQYDRLPALATELVQRQVALIIAIGRTSFALTGQHTNATLPNNVY